jgi:hypothetical protein
VTPALRRLTVCAYLRRLALDDKPIVIGPWRSEVGFEALYWLPFLRWAQAYAGLDPARFLVVTRGGAGVLYGAPAIDLYTLRSVTTVRQENAYDYVRTKMQKQTAITPWDRDVLKEAAALQFGRGASYHILHPSWMYWALSPFWDEARGLRYLTSMADFTPIPKIAPPADLPLPEKFVAVKWYARHTFPMSGETEAFLASVTRAIAGQAPIVLLTSGVPSDEHKDIVVEGPNVTLLPQVPADQNLALQAAVLSKATAFVGTYGGAAQLALRMGVPSVSFYQHFGGTAHAHLSLSQWLGLKVGVPFLTGSLKDAHVWRQVLREQPAKPASDLVAVGA